MLIEAIMSRPRSTVPLGEYVESEARVRAARTVRPIGQPFQSRYEILSDNLTLEARVDRVRAMGYGINSIAATLLARILDAPQSEGRPPTGTTLRFAREPLYALGFTEPVSVWQLRTWAESRTAFVSVHDALDLLDHFVGVEPGDHCRVLMQPVEVTGILKCLSLCGNGPTLYAHPMRPGLERFDPETEFIFRL